ncbi:hypothetical protein PFISCL1PPCAC_7895, partial [Pristionchus fissidentatus]
PLQIGLGYSRHEPLSGAMYNRSNTECCREIASAQVFFRIEIAPELLEVMAASSKWDYYSNLRKQNMTPSIVEGPSSHVWLREEVDDR